MTVPDDVLAHLAQRVRRAPAGLGGNRLVCIDGPAGSGKTTLAAQLADELGAEIVHMDDLYDGWTGIDAGADQLLDSVLEPLAHGRTGDFRRYDWTTGAYAERCAVHPSAVLVVEGCGSAPRGADVYEPFVVWVEAPDDVRLARGLARDGQAVAEHWRHFMTLEREHFAAHGTRGRAHVHLDGSGHLVDGEGGGGVGGAVVIPTRSWYARDPLVVAEELLGMCITRHSAEGSVTARITEVEAYLGAQDPGSHAFRGRTARNATMFGPPGHLYVYRHLGLHACMNVVAGPPDLASGILLRAGEIVEGRELATARRTRRGVVRSRHQLAGGPARFTVALGIDHLHDGTDVTAASGAIVVHGRPDAGGRLVQRGPRVGVSGPGGDGDVYPWRLWLAGDPSVSAYRAAPAPRGRGRGSAQRG